APRKTLMSSSERWERRPGHAPPKGNLTHTRKLCSTSLGATRPCASRRCVDSCPRSCTRPLGNGPNAKATDPSRRVGFLISLRGASEPVILTPKARRICFEVGRLAPWWLPLAPGREPHGAQVGEPGKGRLQVVGAQAGRTRQLGQRLPSVGELDHARDRRIGPGDPDAAIWGE